MHFAILMAIMQFELSPVELYNLGNEHFAKGEYSEAIAAYEQANKGVINANVLYNLGCAYFKKGMIGKAILNMRRAYFLAPRDGDIRYNLAFMRNYRADKISSTESPVMKLLSGIFRFFSHAEARVLMALFFIVFSLALSFYVMRRRSAFGYAAIVSVVLCLFSFISWQVWSGEKRGHHAVVTATEVSALSGPGEDYKEILAIHDGVEVKVRDRRGDFVLIQLPGGIGGWAPMATVEYIH